MILAASVIYFIQLKDWKQYVPAQAIVKSVRYEPALKGPQPLMYVEICLIDPRQLCKVIKERSDQTPVRRFDEMNPTGSTIPVWIHPDHLASIKIFPQPKPTLGFWLAILTPIGLMLGLLIAMVFGDKEAVKWKA